MLALKCVLSSLGIEYQFPIKVKGKTNHYSLMLEDDLIKQRFLQCAILFCGLRDLRTSLEALHVISPLWPLFQGSGSKIPDSSDHQGHIKFSILT